LREIFWMGRSNCKTKNKPDDFILELPDHVDRYDIEYPANEMTSFYCDMTEEPWITEEGWIQLLQMYVTASSIPEGSENTWNILWLYVPDYMHNGHMSEISKIP